LKRRYFGEHCLSFEVLGVAGGVDILHLFPELAAIGRNQLQTYCDEWLKRPIARQFSVAQLFLDEKLLLSIHIDPARPHRDGDKIVLPIDELLGFIVDRHFANPDERQQLHQSVRDTRQRWIEMNRNYEVTLGRAETLYLTCKNPACRAEMETGQKATKYQTITCPPVELMCPACGATATYQGDDLHLLAVN
jgi:hypothetical protein